MARRRRCGPGDADMPLSLFKAVRHGDTAVLVLRLIVRLTYELVKRWVEGDDTWHGDG